MPRYGAQSQKVYVIQHELGPVKIGIAERPETRLSELQVACPFELWIKNTATPNDAQQVEKYLHRFFRKYHMRGEWFDIPAGERDFDIPTAISDSGKPNTDMDLAEIRFVNHEWAMFFERVLRTVKKTKHLTPEISELRTQWRKMHPDLSEDVASEPELESGPTDIDGAMEDTPGDKARCAHCGHHFDRTEWRCPRCGSEMMDEGDDANGPW